METINLEIPFDKKNWAKKQGCKWDAYNKTWYIIKDNIKPCLQEYIKNNKVIIRDTITQYKLYQCNLHFTCINPQLKNSIELEQRRLNTINNDENQIIDFIKNL